MEEEVMNEVDNSQSEEQAIQESAILAAEAEVADSNTRAIDLLLGYVCGKVGKAEIEALYNERNASHEKVKDAINIINSLGKVEQTLEGNGTMENPYKGWQVGMTVEEGKWYLTSEGWLWECIKSGTPTSETDKEYFDVVGI